VSGREVIKILTRIGFQVVGRKGSHIRLKKRNEKILIVVVPDHPELAKGTLRSIIRRANLSVEEFIRLIKS
jgi:predicted RNA binding protein YcfA (HicA-like mRNA interferase family)